MSSYDRWKSTDPADMDPYRDTDCPSCGASEGYRCDAECECDACRLANELDERERDEDDRQRFADPRDERERRIHGD